MAKRLILIAFFLLLVTLGSAQPQAVTAHSRAHHAVSIRLERARQAASVCFLTGLTGPARQENTQFCSTNTLTGVTTDCCSSVYMQAIHLAQQKSIVVGTPQYLQQSVDWGGVPVTWVRFNSGFYAWHYDPSNGIATIEDATNHVLYSGK